MPPPVPTTPATTPATTRNAAVTGVIVVPSRTRGARPSTPVRDSRSVCAPTGAPGRRDGGRLTMFAQVIQGRTSDEESLRRATDRWMQELAPGAEGWLGATAGVTDDGRFVVVVRFESADAARRNSERPEQGRWWEATSSAFQDVTFLDSDDVLVELTGDPGRAEFVRV